MLLYVAAWLLSLLGVDLRFLYAPTPLGIGISVLIVIVGRSTSRSISTSSRRQRRRGSRSTCSGTQPSG